MTSTLHWLRQTPLTLWLEHHTHLLGKNDALFISVTQQTEWPKTSPVDQRIYARKQQLAAQSTTVPDYVVLKSDKEWVELVLSFQQQMTW